MTHENKTKIGLGAFIYALLGVILIWGYTLFGNSAWHGNAGLHTTMETIATLLALIVGLLAMARFYARQSNTFLLIGIGFIGAGLLDTYHAVVISAFLVGDFPSAHLSLGSSSWDVSQMFLSLLLFLSWWAGRRPDKRGQAGKIRQRMVYGLIAALTLAGLLFFGFVSLPWAYYREHFFGRLAAFISAFLLVLALLGYLRKGRWRHDPFEYWLTLSIGTGLIGQTAFMPFSAQLFDVMFDMTHGLKILSYIFVLTGLVISMYHLFKQAAESTRELAQANAALRRAITEAQIIYRVAHSLVAVDNLPDLLQTVVDSIAKVLPADRAILITLDLARREVIHFVGGGPGSNQIMPVSFDELWDGLNGWAIRELKPALSPKDIPDSRESGTVQQRRLEANCGAVLVTPLRHRDTALGTLIAINRPDQRDFTQQDVTLLKVMADQVVIAIENARLFQRHQASEERFRTVINNAPIVIFALDRDGLFTLAEGKGLGALGYKPREVVGQSVFDLYPDYPSVLECVRAALAGQECTSDTSMAGLTFETRYLPLREDGQQVTGVIGVAIDVTGHRQLQDELKEAKDFLDNIINAFEDPVFVKDEQHRFVVLNDAACKVMGRSREELIGKSDYDFNPKQQADVFRETDELVLQTEITNVNEEEVTWQGKSHTISTKKSVLKDPATGKKFIVASMRDITERKRMEEALRLSEERFALAMRGTNDGLWDWDIVNNTLYWSPRLKELLGYADDELKIDFETFTELLHPDDRETAQAAIEVHLKHRGHYNIEQRMRTKWGEYRWFQVRGQAIWDEAGRPVRMAGSSADITNRKRVEAKLQRQSQLLQGVAEASGYLLMHPDLTGAINRILAILGEATGVDRVCIFENHPHPETGELAISQRFAWEREPAEVLKNDSHLQNIPWTTYRLPRWYEVLSTGGSIKGFIREFSAAEQEILAPQQLLSLINVPIMIGDEFWGYLGFDHRQVEHDWSSEEEAILRTMAASIGGALVRKRAEEALALARDEALAAAQAKSEFLANMSHEIRTPLNAVIGMTGLLLDTGLEAEQQDFVETIRTSSDTLLTIINDILDFSKIDAGKLELENQPFDLQSCLEEALDLVAAKAAEKHLDLAYLVEDGLPGAFIGDITRLRQILVNLLSNAVKFTEQGEVVVAVSSRLIRGAEAGGEDAKTAAPQRLSASAPQQHELHFAVHDTGIGIPPDRMDRLFQSFSQVDASTTRRYGGTGLGLAISQRLSELMGGTMWVESQVGQGSTFHFTIRAEAASEQKSLFTYSDQPQLGGKRVLIVDDNATNRRFLSHQTQAWGMLPQAVASGPEALELIRQGLPLDMVLLDMRMPELDGLTLAGEIRRLEETKRRRSEEAKSEDTEITSPPLLASSQLPLVLLTSLGGRDTLPEIQTERIQFAAYLTKPIKASQLYEALVHITAGQSTPANAGIPGERAEPPDREKFVLQTQFDRQMAQDHPLRILLAEDNVVNQKVALAILERLGYRADIVANGLEVLEALMRQSYDAVLMDVQMPEMDGLEATRLIRQQWPIARQPHIIAMTANALKGDREKCLAAGMNDYIDKPVRIAALVRVLEQSQPLAGPTENLVAPAVTPAQPEAMMVDLTVLQNFQTAMGEEGAEFVAELISLFLEDAPKLLTNFQASVEQQDADGLRQAAHTLKSSSANLGLMALSGLCQQLEQMGRAGTLENATETVAQAIAVYEQVKVILELERQKIGSTEV